MSGSNASCEPWHVAPLGTLGLARESSRMTGGSRKVAIDAGHTKDGKRGYDHIHAMGAAVERLPGHFYSGSIAALVFALDVVPDGELNYLDIFGFANPMFTPLVPDNDSCGRPECA
jgi:hypothetical protein